MLKIFSDIWPDKCLTPKQKFTPDSISKLLDDTDVETTMAFDSNDAISLILLDQADEMQ